MESVAPAEADPWRIWLNLLGAPLIHHLSWALRNATGLPLDTIEQALLADRYPERDDVPGFAAP